MPNTTTNSFSRRLPPKKIEKKKQQEQKTVRHSRWHVTSWSPEASKSIERENLHEKYFSLLDIFMSPDIWFIAADENDMKDAAEFKNSLGKTQMNIQKSFD